MRPIVAVLAVVILSSVALVARGEEASVDEQITAILETEAVPTGEAEAEAAPTPAKEKAGGTGAAKPQAAGMPTMSCPMTPPMGGPQAIMAAVADPVVSGFMAVGKLRELARDEKTRQAAMGALESVAQESPEPAIRRAALFVLAEAFGAQGQGDRAAGCLARIARSVSAPGPAPMPVSSPMPCPRCMAQAGPLAQGPCPMPPPPPPAMTPPAPPAPAPRPAQTDTDDALRRKRMEAQVLEAKVAQLQKVLVALQDKVKKTQADTDDQTRRAQMLQAQQTRLEALSRRLEQWQQRLQQSQEKVKQAQGRPAGEEEDDD